MGFKEDIVAKEYTGQTEYEFLLYTGGLSLVTEGFSHVLKDSEGNVKANIGDIIIFTSDERNNTFGTLTYEEIKPNGIYLLTIHVDKEFLSAENTLYPIRIDPTVEFASPDTAIIQDVTIYTGATVYLSDENGAFSNVSQQYLQLNIDGVICHEMGHVLKLTHINSVNNMVYHHFDGERGWYSDDLVYSVMCNGQIQTNPLLSAEPQAHDIINLLSKWEHHLNCEH